MNSSETIVAISSAVGAAARMIARLSGTRAIEIACSVLAAPAWPHPRLARGGHAEIHRLRWREFTIPVWVYHFIAPRSSTGEDVVELHIPGNVVLVKSLLQSLIDAGARQAEAGEFTARAYFNGRIDLTQAEGVAAAISAANETELRAARQLLAGELSRRVRPMIDAIARALALVEVGIDFTEEDVTFLPADELRRIVQSIDADLEQLLGESRRFERLTHEPTIVLVGRPNAGKSTLLNALCGGERAVVSPIAGTTRDAIWAEAALPRGIVRIVDVAGLETQIPPEDDQSPAAQIARQMRERADRAVRAADLVVLVRDGMTDERPLVLIRAPDLVVGTKADLLPAPSPGAPRDRAEHQARELTISAVTGVGMQELRSRLDSLAFGQSTGHTLALNQRHLRAVNETRAALQRVLESAESTPEIVALELRGALDSLGEILGQVTPDDVLGLIFKGFCIGK